MWKIAVAFVAFAGLALFIMSKGGDIDMGGEKHGTEAVHAPAPAASSAAPAAVAAPASAPAAESSAPASAASK